MNSTTGKTAITVTTAKVTLQASTQKRTIYDVRGKSRVREFIRGVQI